MSKESLYHFDKRVIFRETFNNEQDTRNINNGTPTDVSFSDGVGSFNGTSSKIVYKYNLNGIYSIRVKFKAPLSSVNAFIIDFRGNSGTGYIWFNTDGNFADSSGTSYINGEAGSVINNESYELVSTGISLIASSFYVGSRYTSVNYINDDIDLIEIYEGTLTPEEVSLLNKNALYVEPKFSNVLLDINPENGSLYSRIGNTITNANVTIKRQEDIYVEYYNGSNAKLTLGNIGTVKALSFWLYNNGTDQSVLTVDGGTTNLTVASNVLSSLGTDRYVNNVNTDTLSLGWNFVTIISTTGLTASNLIFGNAGANYFKGFMGRKQANSGVITFSQHVNFYNSTKERYGL